MPLTWNPSDIGPDITLSNGNLTATITTPSGGFYVNGRGNACVLAGKKYAEFVLTWQTDGGSGPGFADRAARLGEDAGSWFGNDLDSLCAFVRPTGFNVYFNNILRASLGTYTISSGSTVLRMAVDFDAQNLWFNADNQGWNGVPSGGDPAAGTGGVSFAGLNAGPYFPGFCLYELDTTPKASIVATFDGFAFAPPSGFSPFPGPEGWPTTINVILH